MQAKSENSSGLLLLNKLSGYTSFEALKDVKKTFATGKAGHTGTLDKFASGLLLVLVGRGLKLVPLFEDHAKEYIGTIAFGAETDTLDPEGEVIARGELPSLEKIEAALDNFRGEILQAPPAYSALHIEGRRAYELAREGKEPEMKKRPVTIHELSILSWTAEKTEIKVKVSAGTYIRSLARDIALAAGSRAHLSALKRTGIGPFRLEDAAEGNLSGALIPLDGKLFSTLSLPCFFINKKAEEDFVHGRPLEALLPDKSPAALIPAAPYAGIFRETPPNELLGVIKRKNDKWVYGNVFAGN